MLRSWTIYKLPQGASKRFLARRFEGKYSTVDIIASNNIDQLRNTLPEGLVCFKRAESDDPSIIETWL